MPTDLVPAAIIGASIGLLLGVVALRLFLWANSPGFFFDSSWEVDEHGRWLDGDCTTPECRFPAGHRRPCFTGALPVDDGPLSYDGHTVPTVDELRGYSFGDELLAPVRERLL